ncbi:hypothetical protein PBI_GRAYSON_256 [Rhodococcus phage Grayson]|nr:hypothetical protein PBI_GRAYSON_256 [Rhodococcus phage Grayson]
MKDNDYIFFKERYLLSNPEQTLEFNLIDKDPLEPVPAYGYRYIFIVRGHVMYTLKYHADTLEWLHAYKKQIKLNKKWNKAFNAGDVEKHNRILDKSYKAEEKMNKFSHVILKWELI